MSEPSEYTVEHVREALVQEAGELELDVAVNGERVVVRGTVATDARRDHVTEIIGGCCPGLEVRNEIEVVPLRAEDDAETLR